MVALRVFWVLLACVLLNLPVSPALGGDGSVDCSSGAAECSAVPSPCLCPDWSHASPVGEPEVDLPLLAVSPEGLVVTAVRDAEGRLMVQARDPSDGALVWTTTWGAADAFVLPHALVVQDGTVFVTGAVDGATLDGFVVARAVEDGRLSWSRTWSNGYLTDLVASADGARLVVIGARALGGLTLGDPGPVDADMFVTALDAAAGTTLWETLFPEPFSVDVAHAVALSPSEDVVYVGGAATQELVLTFVKQVRVVALEASTGLPRWVHRMPEVATSLPLPLEKAADLAPLTGGGVIVGGNFGVLRLDAGGVLLWESAFPGGASFNGWRYDLVLDEPRQIVSLSGTATRGFAYDMGLLSLDLASGERRWMRSFDPSGGETDWTWGTVAAPSTDRVYLLGGSGPAETTAPFVLEVGLPEGAVTRAFSLPGVEMEAIYSGGALHEDRLFVAGVEGAPAGTGAMLVVAAYGVG